MPKRAVLLVNLGSPDSCSVNDVKRYLREFLGDQRVIDRPPFPLNWFLVNCIIVPFRAPKSAHAYSAVWTPQGSPLVVTSRSVQTKLSLELGAETPVFLAMRYGNPSIASAVETMSSQGIGEVLLIPQYPQYAMSSWETVVVKTYQEFSRLAPNIKLNCLSPFYRDSDYVETLYRTVEPYLGQPYDHLLFSFHGIPIRHLKKADTSRAHCTCVKNCCETVSPVQSTCYKAQCLATVRAFAARAGLGSERYSVSFQSRLAGEPWLAPYTDETLRLLPQQGKRRLLVITPAFVADCLETLEEIAIEGEKTFKQAGGEWFQAIPCLNDQKPYITFLADRARRWLADCPSSG